MFADASRDRALAFVESQIANVVDGLLANADALAERPTDREAGQRIRSHLIDLERLVTIRNGL